jgi:RimJ/RimL family protein N-acetyltransferase
MPLPLRTDRLLIRRFTLADVGAIGAVWGDPTVMRFVGRGLPLDRVAAADALMGIVARYRLSGAGDWAVTLSGDACLIGEAGLQPLEGGPETEVTYTLGRRWWGRGYGSEAVAAVLGYAFGELGLSRIVAVVHPRNAASLALLEKLGMVREGVGHHYGGELVRFAMTAVRWAEVGGDSSPPSRERP